MVLSPVSFDFFFLALHLVIPSQYLPAVVSEFGIKVLLLKLLLKSLHLAFFSSSIYHFSLLVFYPLFLRKEWIILHNLLLLQLRLVVQSSQVHHIFPKLVADLF